MIWAIILLVIAALILKWILSHEKAAFDLDQMRTPATKLVRARVA